MISRRIRRMRTRHQEGRVEERGKRKRRWYGHYYVYVINESGKEIRRHVGVSLGEKAKLTKWKAEEELRKIIASATGSQPRQRRQRNARMVYPREIYSSP